MTSEIEHDEDGARYHYRVQLLKAKLKRPPIFFNYILPKASTAGIIDFVRQGNKFSIKNKIVKCYFI